MIIYLSIFSISFTIFRCANITVPLSSEHNNNEKSMIVNLVNPLIAELKINTNTISNKPNNPAIQSTDLLTTTSNFKSEPRFIQNYFYSYEIIINWLDDYSFRSLKILEDIKQRRNDNLVKKDPNENYMIDVDIEFLKKSANRVWEYLKAFEKCIPIISAIKKSRFAIIDSFYAKILEMKRFLIIDCTSWTQIDQELSKKHFFLKDHDDYEAKTSLSYKGYQFYRRKSNHECVLIAHKSAYISEGFKFGNCVVVDKGTMIHKNVTIGNRTWIGHECRINIFTEIGNDCVLTEYIKIGEYVSIGNNNIFLHRANVARNNYYDIKDQKDDEIHFYKRICEESFQFISKKEDSDKNKEKLFKVLIGNENIFDTASSVDSFTIIMNNNYFGEFSHIYSFASIQFYNFFHKYNHVYSFTKIGNNNIFHLNSRIKKFYVINDFTILDENVVLQFK